MQTIIASLLRAIANNGYHKDELHDVASLSHRVPSSALTPQSR